MPSRALHCHTDPPAAQDASRRKSGVKDLEGSPHKDPDEEEDLGKKRKKERNPNAEDLKGAPEVVRAEELAAAVSQVSRCAPCDLPLCRLVTGLALRPNACRNQSIGRLSLSRVVSCRSLPPR